MKKIVLLAALITAQIGFAIPKLDGDIGPTYRDIVKNLPTFNFVDGTYTLAANKDAFERIQKEQELASTYLARTNITEKERTLSDTSALFLYYLEQLMYVIQNAVQTYVTSRKTAPYNFGRDTLEYIAQFKKFTADSFQKSVNAASKDISALAKKAEDFLKNDLLKGNIWLVQKNATTDDAFANAYAQGLLLFLLNEHFEPDTKTLGQIMTLWSKKPTELSKIQSTGLYQQVVSLLGSRSLSDLGASLATLKASL